MPKNLFDDPADELAKGPHAEPDNDESYIDDVMGKDFQNPDEEGIGSPLEDALIGAGFKVTPEQLTQIEAILKPAPAAKPSMGGKPAGGMMPAGMKPSDGAPLS